MEKAIAGHHSTKQSYKPLILLLCYFQSQLFSTKNGWMSFLLAGTKLMEPIS